ncbi:uncharacterized protein EI97DRAFT_117807 [Westerdykella ornata]|uniref:Uncharacterized protein n=1 Tax=Westerdykella ornata TaxID=318751 RepID=A0A6A6JV72_WESOR|nr:uncharacterized protein EI97DRAFT_117807 [Westerdykella ornata]KAF2280287.1 hypothetical protein EI97DRAFT_117807 [Westerdykella ornata]
MLLLGMEGYKAILALTEAAPPTRGLAHPLHEISVRGIVEVTSDSSPVLALLFRLHRPSCTRGGRAGGTTRTSIGLLSSVTGVTSVTRSGVVIAAGHSRIVGLRGPAHTEAMNWMVKRTDRCFGRAFTLHGIFSCIYLVCRFLSSVTTPHSHLHQAQYKRMVRTLIGLSRWSSEGCIITGEYSQGNMLLSNNAD